ncbi:C2H2-like zinc finger protein [Quillaja saponaria]|uniref:C2H2-like zinc finger protein n=1 Tax=Quillaja saponaria TaxID=32244 RepID=A0AAD7LIX5_QUISA|nr:C2H2-like zinc finger protein [Quillaja saponaria]
MLRRAKEANLGTVVVGDWNRALGPHADLWVPWIGVENGKLSEEDLVPKGRRRSQSSARDDGFFSVTECDGEIDGLSELDSVLDELVAMRTEFNEVKSSAFSDGEEEKKWVTGELNQLGD